MQLVATRCNTTERIDDMRRVVDAIEVDLMKTKDGKIVVGHPTEYQVKEYTFERFRNAIPGGLTLDELIQISLREDLFVFLDLKYEEMGELVTRELLKHALVRREWLRDKVVVIARSQENLVALANASLDLKTGWIFEGALNDPRSDFDRLHCLYFIGCHYDLTPKFLEKFRAVSGLKLCVRNIEGVSQIREMAQLGVDFVFKLR